MGTIKEQFQLSSEELSYRFLPTKRDFFEFQAVMRCEFVIARRNPVKVYLHCNKDKNSWQDCRCKQIRHFCRIIYKSRKLGKCKFYAPSPKDGNLAVVLHKILEGPDLILCRLSFVINMLYFAQATKFGSYIVGFVDPKCSRE